MKAPIYSAWMTCSQCSGKGIVLNTYTGDPDDCQFCGGTGLERARDNKGRFMKGSLPPPKRTYPTKASST